VRSLAACLNASWPAALDRCGLAAIGSTTRAALIETGVPPGLVTTAAAPGLDGLVRAAAEAARRGGARATADISRNPTKASEATP
jgi:uroporphyrinogen-III synthase